MGFGSCLIRENGCLRRLAPQSVSIHGSLHGVVAQFVVRQEFLHNGTNPADVDYITSNNLNLCTYDTTFHVGDEVIKPQVEETKEAEAIFEEAKEQSRTAILAREIGNGLVRYQLGNIPPDTLVVVEVKACVFSHMSAEDAFQFKMPLDVCTQNGSVGCIMKDIAGPLSFTFDCLSRKAEVAEVTTNVSGCVYDQTSCRASFSTRSNDLSAVIVTVKMSHPLADECLSAGKYMALSVTGRELEKAMSEVNNNEFVFVVDCSGSMSGRRIVSARESLQVFISSLRLGSYFNVVCFGSQYKPLFESPREYNAETYAKAKNLAAELEANLGGTDILSVLKYVFSQPLKGLGQRQVFLLTDGEVHNTDQCVRLVRENNSDNRVFTLGIGVGADSGLIHGLADASGGDSAYVMDERISETVIPQLRSSTGGIVVMNGTVHIESHDQLESTRPVQIRPHSQNNYMIKSNKEFSGDEIVLISGRGDDNVEICVTTMKTGPEQCESVSDAFKALFSYELIQKLTHRYQSERDEHQRNELKAKVIELSKSSGVLSMFTSFVGFSEKRTSSWGCQRDITVKTLTGKCLSINGCTSVRQLRERIQECEGIAADQMRLVAAGRLLDDDDLAPPVTETVHLVLALRAGGPEMPTSSNPRRTAERTNPAIEEKLTLHRLLALQSVDGHWKDVTPALRLIGKQILMLKKIEDLEMGEEAKKDAFNTCIAVALLRHHFSERLQAWVLAEEKAMLWLSSLSKAARWEEFISEIMTHI